VADNSVFISYGRSDFVFVGRLTQSLAGHGRKVWVDTENLRPSQLFWEKIEGAIDAAVTFLAVLSPSSAASPQCAREIQRALDNRQQIIPILWREVDWNGGAVSESVRRLRDSIEFTSFVDPAGFDDALDLLIRTLDNEWEHEEKSAELRALAIHWENNQRSDGSTLNADQLRRFQDWVTDGTRRGIELTERQRTFLLASQDKAERDRKKLEDALAATRVRESLLLASQSRQQTAAGRPDIGAKLALLALPRRLEEPERPWVAAAESALFAAIAQSHFLLEIDGKKEDLHTSGISADGKYAFLGYDALGGLRIELFHVNSGERIKAFIDAYYSFMSAAFSPDGRFLAIGYVHGSGTIVDSAGKIQGNLIHIVDPGSGDTIHKCKVPGIKSTYLRFSPSSRILLVGTDQGLLLLDTESWQAVDGDQSTRGVSFARFSDDESKVVLATLDFSGAIMDRSARNIRRLYVVENKLTTSLLLTGLADDLVVAAVGSSLLWFDTQNESRYGKLPIQDRARILASELIRAPQRIVAITEDGRWRSWREGKESIELDIGRESSVLLRSATFSETGTTALVEFVDGAVEIWVLESQERIGLLPAGARTLQSAGFDSGGSRALIATSDNVARVWDRRMALEPSHSLETNGKKASALALRPGRAHVAIGYDDGSIEVKALTDNTTIWKIEAAHSGTVGFLAFDPKGDRLVTASADQTAAIWDLEGTEPLHRLAGHGQLVSFGGFSPDGTLIATASSDSTAGIWRADSGEILHVLPLPDRYRDLIHNASINHHAVFTSDGRRLITVSAGDGMNVRQPALVWDVQSGELLHALSHEGGIWHVSVTPDDRYAVTSSYDQTVGLWDLETGARLYTFAGHTATVFKAFAADGQLVSISADGSIRIWELGSATPVHELRGHEGAVRDLAVSSDHRFLATGGSDGAVSVWDRALGSLVFQIHGLDGPVYDLIFSQEHRCLVTRTKTGKVQAWPLPPLGQPLLDLAWGWYAPDGELLDRAQRVRFNLEEA
jgi:WD40 repeat protein